MSFLARILPALVLLRVTAAPAQQPPVSKPLAITHVTVIDTEDGSARSDMTVLIREGRIAGIEPKAARVPSDALQWDGRGKFVIPGLWDMHVHLSWTTSSALPVLLANGVTGVLDLGSDLAELDAWRAEIAAGVRAGSRILRVGPILNGRSFNRYQMVTGNPEQARGIVRTLKQVGVDYIKVHRRVPRDDYFAIVDEAKKQGLTVVGHIPMTVRPEEASDAGQLIEHEETLFEGTFAAGLADSQVTTAIHQFLASPAADTLFARFVRNHTPVTATLVAWQYAVAWADSSWATDPRMKYVARSTIETTKKQPPTSPEDLAGLKQIFATNREILTRLYRSGVTLLAGTDIAGPRIPGFSLHDELALMVAAGLTPLEALRTATRNPAQFLKKEADFGNVRAGRVADLVVLDANPLDDIRNTQRIAAVVFGGRLLQPADLQGLLRAAEEMAHAQ